MNNGKVKQEIWAPAIRLTPLGNGYNWNVISVDGFNSLEDLYTNGGLDYPDMSSVRCLKLFKIRCRMVGTSKSFGNELCGWMTDGEYKNEINPNKFMNYLNASELILGAFLY